MVRARGTGRGRGGRRRGGRGRGGHGGRTYPLNLGSEASLIEENQCDWNFGMLLSNLILRFLLSLL